MPAFSKLNRIFHCPNLDHPHSVLAPSLQAQEQTHLTMHRKKSFRVTSLHPNFDSLRPFSKSNVDISTL
uniref:Uncharacterized protein n=1 Tax=Anguilla anguilla TaxID=7936 RepID=A0A0E9X016_ANGAN